MNVDLNLAWEDEEDEEGARRRQRRRLHSAQQTSTGTHDQYMWFNTRVRPAGTFCALERPECKSV